MFKYAKFLFTEPICLCPKQDLEWGIISNECHPALSVTCRICKTTLEIPNMKAGLYFDTPYPENREID
jgi:hypothetical protein